jgi:hypothetical protein
VSAASFGSRITSILSWWTDESGECSAIRAELAPMRAMPCDATLNRFRQVPNDARGVSCDDTSWRHIIGHDAAGADHGVAADMNTGKDDGFRANPHVIFYDNGRRWRELRMPDYIMLVVVHNERIVAKKAPSPDFNGGARGNRRAIVDERVLPDLDPPAGVRDQFDRHHGPDKTHPLTKDQLTLAGDMETALQAYREWNACLAQYAPLCVQDADSIRHFFGERPHLLQRLLEKIDGVGIANLPIAPNRQMARLVYLVLPSANAP